MIVGGSASPHWKAEAYVCVRVCVCVRPWWGDMLSFPTQVPPLCLLSSLNARQILSYDLIHCKGKKERDVRECDSFSLLCLKRTLRLKSDIDYTAL